MAWNKWRKPALEPVAETLVGMGGLGGDGADPNKLPPSFLWFPANAAVRPTLMNSAPLTSRSIVR